MIITADGFVKYEGNVANKIIYNNKLKKFTIRTIIIQKNHSIDHTLYHSLEKCKNECKQLNSIHK